MSHLALLRPLADPASLVARMVEMDRLQMREFASGPNEKGTAPSGPCRMHRPQGFSGAGERVTNGNAWPQSREREEQIPNCRGPLGACVVHAASRETLDADSGQTVAPAKKVDMRQQAS